MRAIPILIAALTLTGCAAWLPTLATPKLSVVNVELLKGDLWEQRMRVRMRVENPNDRAIPVKGVTCALDVQGEEFAHGITGANFDVPALGEAEFDMNMTANVAGALIKMFGRGGESGPIDYRVTGKIALSRGLVRSIPFEEHGTFRLR